MCKKIIIGLVVLFLIVAALWLVFSQEEEEQESYTIQESRIIAEEWIKQNSPTYIFDGENLELVSEQSIIEGSTYEFIFSFQSRHAGYGDRSNEMVAQVITDHLMEVIVSGGEVIAAITDDIYSEIDSMMISEPSLTTISLYFGKENHGEDLIEVKRDIAFTQAVAEAALTELISGPNEQQKQEGYFSSINPNTEIQEIFVENGVAYVDFSEDLQENVGGSAMVSFIRSQIEKTLIQFDTVDSVVISINGEQEDILQP